LVLSGGLTQQATEAWCRFLTTEALTIERRLNSTGWVSIEKPLNSTGWVSEEIEVECNPTCVIMDGVLFRRNWTTGYFYSMN
jgi:hypothetical protein